MCGRFTLRTRAEEIALHFFLADVPDLKPRYNIAPTQKVATIRFDPQRGNRQLSLLRWGLIPSWADNPAIGNRLINARSETVATSRHSAKPFRKAAVSSLRTDSSNGRKPASPSSRTTFD